MVIHCASEQQARDVRDAVARRLADVGLEIHPGKTRIVYCKDSNRTGEHEHISFTFLSYTFRPRQAWNRKRQVAFFAGFSNGSVPGEGHGVQPQNARSAAAPAHQPDPE